jgi:catechol 2,3-dioxygenase
MADHLVSEALYLSDPDGLGIEIYADRARRGTIGIGNRR